MLLSMPRMALMASGKCHLHSVSRHLQYLLFPPPHSYTTALSRVSQQSGIFSEVVYSVNDLLSSCLKDAISLRISGKR